MKKYSKRMTEVEDDREGEDREEDDREREEDREEEVWQMSAAEESDWPSSDDGAMADL